MPARRNGREVDLYQDMYSLTQTCLALEWQPPFCRPENSIRMSASRRKPEYFLFPGVLGLESVWEALSCIEYPFLASRGFPMRIQPIVV